jgi:hypothetical protein
MKRLRSTTPAGSRQRLIADRANGNRLPTGTHRVLPVVPLFYRTSTNSPRGVRLALRPATQTVPLRRRLHRGRPGAGQRGPALNLWRRRTRRGRPRPASSPLIRALPGERLLLGVLRGPNYSERMATIVSSINRWFPAPSNSTRNALAFAAIWETLNSRIDTNRDLNRFFMYVRRQPATRGSSTVRCQSNRTILSVASPSDPLVICNPEGCPERPRRLDAGLPARAGCAGGLRSTRRS